MNTIEIIQKLEALALSDPLLLENFSWPDLEHCMITEIECRRESYPDRHFLELIRLIRKACEQAAVTVAECDSKMLLRILSELRGIAEALPPAADENPLLQQAAFDHALLDHIRNDSIVVLGDSHVYFFSGNEGLSYTPIGHGISLCPRANSLNLTVLYLGPVLAFTCLKPGSTAGFSEKLSFLKADFITPGARILISLGEIDIRMHVLKQAEMQKRPTESIIDDILTNYGTLIASLQSEGFKISCWGPIASQKDGIPEDPRFPRLGSEKERNSATLYFNRQLEKTCHRCGAGYFSIYDRLVDVQGFTKEEYLSDDHFHLSQRAMPLAMEVLASLLS
ncbi:MAG: SGNH/GDSL hydrolase family protein [Lachnospiraceae bacterium]|nr:SGNH/GDSL hydrolase family protein [Lachnospiraceae bacterium]